VRVSEQVEAVVEAVVNAETGGANRDAGHVPASSSDARPPSLQAGVRGRLSGSSSEQDKSLARKTEEWRELYRGTKNGCIISQVFNKASFSIEKRFFQNLSLSLFSINTLG